MANNYPTSGNKKQQPKQTAIQKVAPQKVAPKESTVLDVLFPEQEVVLPNDVIVVVRPLSLEDLPRVSQSFGRIMVYAESGLGPAEIAGAAFSELSKLIPFCINVPPKEIPASYGPEIMEIMVEQNVNENVIKKWQALVAKMIEFQPKEPDQGEEESQTSRK